VTEFTEMSALIGMPIDQMLDPMAELPSENALLIPVQGQNIVACLQAMRNSNLLQKRLRNAGYKVFCVFPSVKQPLVIYQQNSGASNYTREYVISKSPQLWKRVLRRGLEVATSCDFNVGGYLFIPE